MTRPCENVNFCLFCECYYLHNGESWDCARDEGCVVNSTIVAWWAMSLQPRHLIHSNPPAGCKQVANVYFDPNVGSNGKYVMEREA